MKDCIFCKIINKEARADIIYENEKIIVFYDIRPSAPIHILIVPKKHIKSVREIKEEDRNLMGELFLVAQKIAEEKRIKAYKLLVRTGRQAGQIVDHIHMHLLANK